MWVECFLLSQPRGLRVSCCKGCCEEGRQAGSPEEECKALLLEVVSDLASASIRMDGVAQILVGADADASNGPLALQHAGYVDAISTTIDFYIERLRAVSMEMGL
jgi:hypothetical protein